MKATGLIVLASLLVACGQDEAMVAAESVRYAVPTAEKDMAAAVAMQPVAAFSERGPEAGQAASARVAPPQVVVPSTMVIRNASVSVEVDSLEVAVDRVRRLAISLGGHLGNVSMQTGKHQVRSATLEMKIPAARFDSAMTGMPTLGKVEQSVSTAEDVGEEFVDVNARVANSKRLEARLVALLAARAGKLTDIIAVERELARVRQEIERYEGRIRYLSTRVATSTIVATVHEKAPIIVAQPGTNVFKAAFLNMWRNFVRLLTMSIELAGVFIPIMVVGWVVVFGLRRWRRARVAAPA